MRIRRFVAVLGTAGLLAAGLLLAGSSPANAANFTVTTTADSNNGACTVSLCSLRDAVTAAEVAAGADTVIVPAGTYTLGSVLPNLTNTSIEGAGADPSTGTVISGNGTVGPVLHYTSGGLIAHVSGVVITGGFNTFGAGITSSAALTLTDVAVQGNTATTSFGGGIDSTGLGSLTLLRVTVSGNSSTGSSDGWIFVDNAFSMTNSTISGNTSSSTGGGIFIGGSASHVIVNSTITGNSAPSGGAGIDSNGPVTITNTIVANNTGPSQCTGAGTYTSGGNNLTSGASPTCGFTAGTDQTGVDPLLGPLAFNGGTTRTHLPQAGSTAIDRGNTDPAVCPAADQRGVSRPQDGDGNGTLICDIGAVEVLPPTPTTNTPIVARFTG